MLRLFAWRAALIHRALALLLFAAGWLWLFHQHGLLWQRLPDSTVDRFVADAVAAPLPAPLPVAELRRLCARPPAAGSWLSGARDRTDIARCLGEAQAQVDDSAARAAATVYRAAIESQIGAAEAWAAAFERTAAQHRDTLTGELRRLRGQRPGWPSGLDRWQRPTAEPLPAVDAAARAGSGDDEAARLRRRILATRERLSALDAAALPAAQRARELGLIAAGLEWHEEHESSPPGRYFAAARDGLAEALERRRRGQGYTARGFSLSRLHALPDLLFASAACLMAVVVAVGAPALPWASATLLLGAGAALLSDLALTGDPAFRYLVERQFHALGTASHDVPLVLTVAGAGAAAPLRLWWPLVAVGLALLALRCLRDGSGLAMRPLRAWIRCGARPGAGALQAAALAAVGAVSVLVVGLPAAVSEWLIALGCAGLATYVARQAPRANAGSGLDAANLVVAAGAFAATVGLAGWRGDLGHAVVASAAAGCFLWLFAGPSRRAALTIGALVVTGLLSATLLQWQPLPWLQTAVGAVPAHVQQRIDGMVDPFSADSSDLARVRWLIASAGLDGWGTGQVPWQGFGPGDSRAGLPLQGPSDYLLGLAVAVWGRAGGLLLMGAVPLLFGLAARQAARTALASGMPPGVRWLAAFGWFGCVAVLAKGLLSLGGVAGLLPLSGLPVALLGYGPVGLLAALTYLGLALGLGHVRPAPSRLGPQVAPGGRAGGAVRRRAAALAGFAVLGLTGVLIAAFWQLRDGRNPDHHLAKARYQRALAVAQALTAQPLPVAVAWPCPQLADAVARWDSRLVDAKLRLDPVRLLAAAPVADPAGCRQLARTLASLLRFDLARVLGGRSHRATTRLAAFEPATSPQPRRHDFSTANAWWGLPGCLHTLDGKAAAGCGDGIDNLEWLTRDAWLQRELSPRLRTALHTPVGAVERHGHAVSTGPQLRLSLDPRLQAVGQRIADCYTARAAAADCAALLPADAGARRAALLPGALRAGALGVVLVEVDSGRIVALAGSISDCSLAALDRHAAGPPAGAAPAVRAGAGCAQWPDRRARYLALQPPALWMVPPGSALKPLAVLAGIDSRLIDARDDARWTAVLAESHDQASVQRIALEAGPRYLDVLADLGFSGGGADDVDLLWGGRATGQPTPGAGWRVGWRSGAAGLRAGTLPFATLTRMRAELEAGDDVDRRYGPAPMRDYLAARRLVDASIGGADMRVSALGLADLWRRLELRARGHAEGPAVHLLERLDRPVPRIGLGFASTEAARRTLEMTRGITASAWRGSASGACRVVFGHCPADGLAGLVGKTGTSDFLVREGAADAKPGQQLPAKLFGGVFGDGHRRYAVAVMALRVPVGETRRLELAGSAAAEAALTLVRALRQDDAGESDEFRAPPSSPAAKPAPGAADHDSR